MTLTCIFPKVAILKNNKQIAIFVSLFSKGPIRLRNGMNPLEGRVEIFNGTYGLVCDEGWDMKDAAVVCQQLGDYAAIEATTGSQFTPIGAGPSLPIFMANVSK